MLSPILERSLWERTQKSQLWGGGWWGKGRDLSFRITAVPLPPHQPSFWVAVRSRSAGVVDV